MLASLSALLILQTGTPTLLRVKPVKGASYGYEIRFSMKAKQGNMEAVIPVNDLFAGMAGKNHLWSVSFTKPTMKGTGVFKSYADSTAEEFTNLKILYERKPTYVPIAATVEKTRMPMSLEKDGTSDIIFPEKAVKVGGTWPGKIQAGSSMFDMTYKYLGPSTYKNRKSWKIEGIPKGQGIKVIRPYVWQVDQRDGRTIFAEGEVEMTTGGVTARVIFQIVQTKRKA